MSEPASKSYNPRDVEPRIYRFWLDRGAFRAMPDERPRERRFVMVIPPPNVTGALHLGHALNNTLQDILVRRKRMAGCNTLWLPGTDHAGIATQAVVEKEILKTEKKTRHQLGPTPAAARDELVRRIWAWKERHGGRIIEQLQLMGCSCDWARLRFTLDEQCARAVRETFFNLFRDGLIYRGKRLVNWDTQLQTAVADDEVYHETVRGHLWYVRYPLVGEPLGGEHGPPDRANAGETPTLPMDARVGCDYLVVATTRPETMLGDTALAVHPDDPRYAPLIGRKVRLPLTDREIPIIGDPILVKREFGTGCVKVTPAHDPNDYQCAQRNGLPMINIMTPDGRVNDAGGAYAGLKLEEARKRVVADLEAQGLLEKVEDYETDIGHSDRSKVPIQPYLSDQWFVKMGDLTEEQAARVRTPFFRAYLDCRISERGAQATGLPGLAQMAIDAVEAGRVRFFPERYARTYLDWLSEKRDWCISRQLWWGHRIPVVHATFQRKHFDPGESPRRWQRQKVLCGELQTALNDLANNHSSDADFCVTPDESDAARCFIALRNPRSEELLATAGNPHGIAVEFVGPGHQRTLTQPSVRDDDPRRQPACKVWELITEQSFSEQDPDVLDTWFSSALWPHSTLGWPGQRAGNAHPTTASGPRAPGPTAARAEARGSLSDLDYYYPTTTLSTAREIITLWVARMVMTGLYNVGDVPFRDVVIHAVIQDGQGRKMSKTLGNGVDPVDIIDAYGADALRYTLAELATETQDIRIPVKPMKLSDGRTVNTSERFEKGRNFCNKLWQAATGYVLANLDGAAPRELRRDALALEDRWILSRLAACNAAVDAALDAYRFSDYVQAAYQFMWNDYCDWYVEMTKPRLRAGGESAAAARQILVWCLDRLLRLLHPVAPFITESLWHELNAAAPRRGIATLHDAEPALVTAAWPAPDPAFRDEAVESDLDILKAVIRAIRDVRTRVNALRSRQPALRTLPRAVIRGGKRCCELLATHGTFVRLLAAVDVLDFGADAAKPPGSMTHVHETAEVFVPVGDLVDLAAERERLRAELAGKQDAFQREAERLNNEAFMARAAPEVVERTRARAAELEQQITVLRQHVADLA